MTALKIVALLAAAAFASTALPAASAETQGDQLKLTFSFKSDAKAADIYSSLRSTATFGCKSAGTVSLRQQRADRECAARFLEAAVKQVGRADVAALHGQAKTFDVAGN